MSNDSAASPAFPPVPPAPFPESSSLELHEHLKTLGLNPGASWEEVCQAHARLVADLTPGPGADHRNVELANRLLDEVNQAFDSLRVLSSVA